ncbi:hypothetical protein [Streptomyces sp. 049-1]|uniref:hypothetical protein n=1 Tax=Streptomyces sp. 049-1 TaxID=2789264 RepID=UPI00397ED9BC
MERDACQETKNASIRTAIALAVAVGAVAVTPRGASAVEATSQFWNYKCGDGRAHVYRTDGRVWNIEGCGGERSQRIHNYAKARGNSITAWFDARASVPSQVGHCAGVE